jgi:hypothetical protein
MTSLVFFSFYICFVWEAYRDCFLDFLSLYVIFVFAVSTVEGYSLGGLVTHNLSSLPGLAFLLSFLFCNQLAFARLVIRRAVEMESLQFVGCSWFIGLIGLVSDSPRIQQGPPDR